MGPPGRTGGRGGRAAASGRAGLAGDRARSQNKRGQTGLAPEGVHVWVQGRGRTRLCPLSPCAKRKHLLRNSAQLPAPHPRAPSAAGPRQAAQPPSALSLPRGSARSARPSPAISRGCCAETPAALPRLLNNPHTCAPGGCRPRAGGPSCWARAGAGAAPADPGPPGSGREVLGALEGPPQGAQRLLCPGGPKSRL